MSDFSTTEELSWISIILALLVILGFNKFMFKWLKYFNQLHLITEICFAKITTPFLYIKIYNLVSEFSW